jgi:excisionase family DNA binding protein
MLAPENQCSLDERHPVRRVGDAERAQKARGRLGVDQARQTSGLLGMRKNYTWIGAQGMTSKNSSRTRTTPNPASPALTSMEPELPLTFPTTQSSASVTIPNQPDLVDKYVIAHDCGVSPRTIENWVAQRKIPFLELGHRTIRFRLADVRRALSRKTVKEIS